MEKYFCVSLFTLCRVLCHWTYAACGEILLPTVITVVGERIRQNSCLLLDVFCVVGLFNQPVITVVGVRILQNSSACRLLCYVCCEQFNYPQ